MKQNIIMSFLIGWNMYGIRVALIVFILLINNICYKPGFFCFVLFCFLFLFFVFCFVFLFFAVVKANSYFDKL